jgi:hypothetical protein
MTEPAALYPTKTRLALLRHVQAGKVYEIAPFPHESYDATHGLRKVTGRVGELWRARWITRADPGQQRRSIRWKLTPAGEEVLAAHPNPAEA